MSDWMMKRIRQEAARLLDLAQDDDALREDLRALAQEILAATGKPSAPASPAAAEAEPTVGPRDDSRPVEPSGAASAPVLTLGQAASPAPPPAQGARPRQTAAQVQAAELASLEATCRRKAEAVRWLTEQRRRLREGTDISGAADALDAGMRAWTEQLLDNLHWAQDAASSQTEDAVLEELGGCFEAVAESLSLVAGCSGHPRAVPRPLELLAESQSALRAALMRIGDAWEGCQQDVYDWLRTAAARHRVYLRRYMRADDVADPATWPSMLARIEDARAGERRSPWEAERLEELRRLCEPPPGGSTEARDWPGIIRVVDQLVERGMPPSRRELREPLLRLVDQVPDQEDLPRSFQRVLREIDRFLAIRLQSEAAPAATAPSSEVAEVARLLQGRCIVLIGGNRRRDAQESLRQAFALEALYWIETREHESLAAFEPIITRPEVALVLLAIRWSSHSFGEVRHLCEHLGKPLVRLPGGYSPNQVAAQVLAQSSERLRG